MRKWLRVHPSKMNQFVSSLLKKMTLEEKIGQLNLLTSDMDVTGPTMREGYKDRYEHAGICVLQPA